MMAGNDNASDDIVVALSFFSSSESASLGAAFFSSESASLGAGCLSSLRTLPCVTLLRSSMISYNGKPVECITVPARRHDSEKPATSYKDLEVADASDSESISIIEFVSRLNEKGQTYTDPGSGLNLHELTELLDQKLDSEFISVAKYGYCDVMIAIAETGWPLDGDLTQHGANRENAAV
ncbi:probable glucan endo-1,3-beta-glucosidase A6 [Tanacetum coccineum]